MKKWSNGLKKKFKNIKTSEEFIKCVQKEIKQAFNDYVDSFDGGLKKSYKRNIWKIFKDRGIEKKEL